MASSLIRGVVFQGARSDGPFADTAGATQPLRANKWAELDVQPMGKAFQGYADEGSYFIATNPTPGTGVIGATSAVAADAASGLKADVYIENLIAAGTNPLGKSIYLDYIKMIVVTAGAASSSLHYTTHVDSITSTRLTSGGTAVVPVCTNPKQSSTLTGILVQQGAIVVGTNVAQRIVGGGVIRPTTIEVAGDQYLYTFGHDNQALPQAAPPISTSIGHMVLPHAPVVIPPGSCFFLLNWAASKTTGTTYEFEIGFAFR